LNNKEKLAIIAEAAREKKAEDIRILNMENLVSFTDYFVICHGYTKIQVQAISDNILEKCSEQGLYVDHVEGKSDGRWVLVDMGDIIVHVFQVDEREYYNLERLWGDAPLEQE